MQEQHPNILLTVGLGNPDKQHEHARHNLGFMVLDAYADKLGLTFSLDTKFEAAIAHATTPPRYFLKPMTYMNNSGRAVVHLTRYYGIDPKHLLVIHDDLDLPFGDIKLSFDSGAAGHHGVESIIETLHTSAFWRLRIGVANDNVHAIRHNKAGEAKTEAIGNFVLSPFSAEEQAKLPDVITQAIQALPS